MSLLFSGIVLVIAAWGIKATDAAAEQTPQSPIRQVFVKTSVEAHQALDELSRLESASRWAEAAYGYDRLIAEQGNELIQKDAFHFASVTDHINERFTRWPPEAVRVYQSLFDEPADRQLAGLGNSPSVESLLSIADRWWLTHAGGRAAERAARLLLAAGRCDAANRLFNRLIRTHPNYLQAESPAASKPASCPVFGASPYRNLLTKTATELTELFWQFDPSEIINERSLRAGPVQVTDGDQDRLLCRPVVADDLVLVQDQSHLWAIRLFSGRLEWIYHCSSGGFSPPISEAPICPFGPPVVADGRVFAILAGDIADPLGPPGCSVLVCINVDNGSQHWRTPLYSVSEASSGPYWIVDASLLVYEHYLFVVFRLKSIFGIIDCNLAGFEPDTGRRIWQTQLTGAAVSSLADIKPSRISASDGLINVQTHLGTSACVSSVTGRVYGLELTGGDPEQDEKSAKPGDNALVVDDLMLVADEGRVLCYTRSDEVMARLEERVIAVPRDGGRRLDLARYALSKDAWFERSLSAIDAILALTKADRQVEDGPQEPQAAKIRKQLFDLILDASRLLTTAHFGLERVDAVTALLERARASGCFDDLEQQIRYRMVFAGAYTKLERAAEAIRLYQEILDDPSLCECQYIDEGREVLAGNVAGGRIAAVIDAFGRQGYAYYDAAASAMLTDGVDRGDRALLNEAIKRYPNARATPRALWFLAELERGEGRLTAAVQLLRELLARSAAGEANMQGPELTSIINSQPKEEQESRLLIDEPAVIERIAQCYFDLGDPMRGLAWLARGVRDYPAARFFKADRSETFAQLRRRRLAEEPKLRWRRPMLTLPLSFAYRLSFDGPVIILKPRSEPYPPNTSDGDLALIFHGRRIEALAPASGKQRWIQSLESPRAPVWLGTRGHLIVLSSRYDVFALDAHTGQVCWRVGERPSDADSPAIDPEIFNDLSAQIPGETLLVNIFEDGRASAIQIADGQILWQQRLDYKCREPMAINDQYVVYTTIADGQTRLVVLDVVTGSQVHVIDRLDDRQINWLGFSADRALIAVGSDWVAGYNPDNSAKLWSVDSAKCNRLATTRIGISGLFFSPGEGQMACLALDDGRETWRIDVQGPDQGMILDTWLDKGTIYIAATNVVGAFDASSGLKRWLLQLDDDFVIDSAALAEKAIAVIGSRRAGDEKPSNGRRHVVFFINRHTGQVIPQKEGKYIDLGQWSPAREVAFYDHALLIGDKKDLIGWVAAGLSRMPPSAPTR